jgi:hypothetical protein
MKTKKKIIIACFIFICLAFLCLNFTNKAFAGNSRIWSGAVNSDLNNPLNYSGSGALLTTDDLVFNSGAVAATASANLDVASISVTAGYTGNMSFAGFTATYETGNASFNNGGGTLDLGNGLTMNGASATLTVGSGVGAVTATNCVLTFNGTAGMTFTDTKNATFSSLTLGANAILSNTQVSTFKSSTPLTMGNGSTLTISAPLYLYVVGSNPAYSFLGTYTINGASNLSVLGATASATVTIPAITTTGTVVFLIGNDNVASPTTYSITGAINCYNFYLYCSANNETITINTNDNPITVANNLSMYQSNVAGIFTVNFGASTVSTKNASISGGNYTRINLQTSQWTVTGNWAATSLNNVIVNPGTSTVTFTNTCTITSNGTSFYNVIFNGVGKTFTLGDFMFINSYTLTAGSLALAGYRIFKPSTSNVWIATANGNWNVAGNWSLGHVPLSNEDVLFSGAYSVKNVTFDISPSVNAFVTQADYTGNIIMTGQTLTLADSMAEYGAGTRNYGNGITMNGNSAKLLISSQVGTVTAGSCALTMNGTTGMQLTLNKTITFWGAFQTGASAVVINNGTDALYPYTINLGNNTTLTLTTGMCMYAQIVSPITMGTGVSITGQFNIYNQYNGYVSIPAMSLAGTPNITLMQQSYAGGFNLNGALSINGSLKLASYYQKSFTFNTNNYSISCGSFYYSSSDVASVLTINMGSSAVSCGIFGNTGDTYSPSTVNFNFQSSQWTVSGSWTFLNVAGHIINASTSLVTFTNNSTITSAGKSFYNVAFNGAGKAFTIADAFNCTSYTNPAGYIVLAGDYISQNSINTWSAGTYYLTGNITMGANNLTLDGTNGNIYIKTSGAYQIQQSGTGVLTTANTSLTNKVIFTSKNDNAHGATISGSSGSPASADQSVVYVLLTGTASQTLQYFEVWYGNAGAIQTTIGANSATQNIIWQYGILKYVKVSGAGYPSLIGAVTISYTKLLKSYLFDNINIDTTNSVGSAGSGFISWLNPTYTSTIISNNFINPTFLTASGYFTYGLDIETLGGGNAVVFKNNIVKVSASTNPTISSLVSLVTRGGTATGTFSNNIISVSGIAFYGISNNVVGGSATLTIKNNIIYNCSAIGSYGIYGSATINEDYNDFYNNDTNSFQALGAHSITSNPSLGNIAGGTLNPAFAIPNGYAIAKGSALDKAGSDTFGNLSWDTTQYSPTGYQYGSGDKINMGILYWFSALIQTNIIYPQFIIFN